jgi:hypothetical protein
MKKIYTLAVAMMMGAAAANAQGIVTLHGDTSVATGNVADEFDPFDIHLPIINNTGSEQTFTWMMKGYQTPSANWEVKLCDNKDCYDLLINAGPHESKVVQAGDTMDFKFQFAPHCVNGNAYSDIEVHITNDSAATTRLLHFKAENITNTCASVGIGYVSANNINVYPNPVVNTFVVKGLENGANLNYEVYNIAGMLVESKVIGSNASGAEVSVQGLPQGSYILKAVDVKGVVVATARLNKVD